ncbi:MAG TPA: glycosyltransferase [Candidatus Paceibacterota bacterium]|nr:glycosyltransferase [Candidatus Paceibacterota bacterium]
MPVFFDTSKRRKIYFRALAVFFIFFLLAFVLIFFFGLSEATAERASLPYADIAERYHYYFSAANADKVALTIDDGPTPEASQEFFAALSQAGAPATFFYIGKEALARPDLVREASDDGFIVGNLSFTHAEDAQSSYQRLALELNSTGYLLSQITGQQPLFYRPPYLAGVGSDPTLNPYVPPPKNLLWSLELGYLPVGADVDPTKWYATTTPQMVADLDRAFAENPNGHIILLHEDVATAKALPAMLGYLKEHGYSVVPLSSLLTPPTTISLPSTLSLGATDATTGGAVSQLQWFLYTQKYLDPYALTGVFDSATRSALLNFQTQNKLVDSNNPDPARAGTADAATRNLIYSISLKTTLKAAPAAAFAGTAAGWSAGAAIVLLGLGELMRTIYIYFFPIVYQGLLGMTIFTLVLVGVRSLALVSLIMYGRMRGIYKEIIPEVSEVAGVSVLIPAYNEEENIAATVESVIRSSYPKREIVVLDDGSHDNTAREVRAVIEAYPRDDIQLISLENGGKARALNIGIAHAKYDIIAVLDADAVLEKVALAHFVKHFSDPRVGAVAGKVRTTGSSRMLDIFQTLEYAIGQNIDKRAFSTIGAVGIVPGPAGAWRKSYLMQFGGFSTQTLVEDQDMTLTVLRSGKRVVYEPQAIAYTETPHTVKNFLKQRFRWVYGTMQCVWKHKRVVVERPFSPMTLVVLPNVLIYNILLPLAYPFTDAAFVFGLCFGEMRTLLLPFLIFTAFDMSYAAWGVWKEPGAWRLLIGVPLQRVVYRQLLYWSVMRGVIRAIEGSGAGWNKFRKAGETKRFYQSDLLVPVPSPITIADVSPQLQNTLHTSLIPDESRTAEVSASIASTEARPTFL